VNSAKLFKIHTQIAKIRLMFWFVSAVVYTLGILVGTWEVDMSDKLILKAIVAVLLCVDYFFARKNYLSNFHIVQMIRMPLAMWALVVVIINPNQIYIVSLSTAMYVILLIQILYLTDVARLRHKLVLFFITLLPMIFVSGIKVIQVNHGVFTRNTILYILVLIFYMTFFIILTSQVFAENNQEIRKLRGELKRIRQITRPEDGSKEEPWDNAYEKLSHENSEMLVENLIQQYISSSLEISNLMKLILESLSEALVVNLCSIIVKEEHEDTYQYNTRTIFNSLNLEHFNSYIEDRRLVNQFKQLREPFVDNQVNMKEYDFLSGMDIKSLLICPLVNEGNWLGMLVIGKDTTDYFVDNMSFFERVSTQFSIALMNARIYTKMENMAMKDGLTGIYNRTYMIQKVNEFISDVVLNKSPLAVILFDIDKFKKVNDTYGHLFGDEVIRVCANTAKEIAGKYDGFVARYGGEEFVIVCKEESLEELHNLAQMLHVQIKQTEIVYRGSTLFVNVSIGVAAFPATCGNPAELIDRADKAMYHSKISGRGRITFDGEYVPQ
jgi:diguanylate cyclase (GGDEF)-like protein